MNAGDFAMVREVVDLSVPMKSLDTPVFPGYPQPLRSSYTTVAKEGYASFIWSFVEHSSTHVDSPAHFFDGALTIDQVPLNRYVGPGILLDFMGKGNNYNITREDIESRLKTMDTMPVDGSSLSISDRLLRQIILAGLVGTSCADRVCLQIHRKFESQCGGFRHPESRSPSISRSQDFLLPEKIAIYENLWNLEKLIGKNFFFVGAPLRLYGGSASPVRALALVF